MPNNKDTENLKSSKRKPMSYIKEELYNVITWFFSRGKFVGHKVGHDVYNMQKQKGKTTRKLKQKQSKTKLN